MLAVHHLVNHTRIILDSAQNLVTLYLSVVICKNQGSPKFYVQILLYMHMQQLLSIFHPQIFPVDWWIYLRHKLQEPTMSTTATSRYWVILLNDVINIASRDSVGDILSLLFNPTADFGCLHIGRT